MKTAVLLGLALVVVGVFAKPATRGNSDTDKSLKELLRLFVDEAEAHTFRRGEDGASGKANAGNTIEGAHVAAAAAGSFDAESPDVSTGAKEAADKKKRQLSTQPNFIFMLADDLGSADVSWYDNTLLTPEMQKLVDDGIQLDNNYVQPMCTPSRHTIMTGLYPFHSGMQHGVAQANEPECSPLDQNFMPQYLKELGYDTHMVGKWHLGFCSWECTPTYRGFDTFYGFYNGYIDHYTHMYDVGYDWRDNEDAVKDNAGTYATDLIHNRAVEILKSKDGSKPFFLYLAYNNVHTPHEVPQQYYDLYSDRTDLNDDRKTYLGMLSNMDESIGNIVQTLKDQGLYDNTIIIFSSDNGGENPTGSNAPLRGAKASLFDGGMKAAGFVHSPLLPDSMKGYKADQLLHASDWLPTMVSLAGGTPKDGLDGVDQSDFILNGGPSSRDTIIHNIDDVFPQTFGRKAIRKGDWKLIQGYPGVTDGYDPNVSQPFLMDEYQQYLTKRSNLTKRDDEYTISAEDYALMNTLIVKMEGVNQLFNIKDDPTETTDLSASNPDKVKELSDLLDAAEATIMPVDPAGQIPSAKADPSLYDGVWTPGWC